MWALDVFRLSPITALFGVGWSGFAGLGLMLVGHGCTRLGRRGFVFGSELIEGLDVGVIPILF